MKREFDPTGKSPHEIGAKLDFGKLRYGLILKSMRNAIKAVVEVAEFGAKKYKEESWLEVPNGEERYMEAELRHLYKSFDEELDQDSNLDHLAHLAWCALARLELKIRKRNKENQ